MNARRSFGLGMAALCLGPLSLVLSTARPGHAHPAAAEPPAFYNQPCLTVLDRAEAPTFQLTYGVPVEDTALEPDLVALPDTKTHQFFAVAGQVYPQGIVHMAIPFGDETGAPQALPEWLDAAEIARVRAAAADHATALTALNEAEPIETLEGLPMLAARFHPISQAPSRVPITMMQGVRGVAWDLTQVPVGVYQVAAYIFSPPYNAWAVRPGFIKVVDGDDRGPPVINLENVAARLFDGQGRRIEGCVDAPDGSTVTIGARATSDPEGPFETWLDDVPIADGRFDGCLFNPGMAGAIEVRASLTTPTGETVHVYATEHIELFENPASCKPSPTICCDEAAQGPMPSDASADAGPVDAAEDAGREAPPSTRDAGQPAGPNNATRDDRANADAGLASGPTTAPDAANTTGCQCRFATRPPASPSRVAWLLIVALLLRRTRMRKRMPTSVV